MIRMECPAGSACGGCRGRGEYGGLLMKKQARVSELLKSLCPVEDIVGMDDPFHYRNKVHAAFSRDERGRIIAGPYAGGTHRIVPMDACLIEDEGASRTVRAVWDLMADFGIEPYDEDSGRGLMRHVLIRTARQTGEMLVTLVIGRTPFSAQRAFVAKLVKKCPWITTVCVSLNARRTSMILGPSTRTVYGRGFIEDRLAGKVFALGPNSFYQVNPVQTEKLYAKAYEFAALTGKETVLDAYCGVGTIGLGCAEKAGRVVGVEVNRDAVRDAVGNMKRNGITNASFVCADAGQYMRRLAAEKARIDVVFMDPPRAGSDRRFLDSLSFLSPDRVVYISCMPETLARDLRILRQVGWRAERAVPFDMFPWTEHVETCVLLCRENIEGRKMVSVTYEPTDEEIVPHLSPSATYAELKQWIEEKYQAKVSSLYIAQVKAKHGLEMRENFNKPKSPNAKQPVVPVEKEKMIEEALRHFRMIE